MSEDKAATSGTVNRWQRRKVPLGVGLAVAVLAVANAVSLRHATRLRDSWPGEVDTFHLPPAKALRLASLGHHELVADLLHGKANVYYGTQIEAKTPAKWLARYLHTAIDLDPTFHRLYLNGATMLVYTNKAVDTPSLFMANEILERGRQAFPLDWELPFQLGFNYLYELPQTVDSTDPRIPGWRQKGLEYLQYASQFDGIPYYIPNLIARLLTKQGSVELAIGQLERAYAMTSNQQAREQIQGKLAALRGQAAAKRMETRHKDFLRLIESRYPLASEAFSLLMGPRITAPAILALPEHAPSP